MPNRQPQRVKIDPPRLVEVQTLRPGDGIKTFVKAKEFRVTKSDRKGDEVRITLSNDDVRTYRGTDLVILVSKEREWNL